MRNLLPPDNKLTPTEVHAAVLAGAAGILTGITRTWSQLRTEPWYAAASFIVCLIVGIAARRRYYKA